MIDTQISLIQPATTLASARLREMEADAAEDPDIARVLEGANGDPEVVRERVSRSCCEAGVCCSVHTPRVRQCSTRGDPITHA